MDKIRTQQKTFKQKLHRNYSFPLLEKENLTNTINLPALPPPPSRLTPKNYNY